MKVLFLVLVPCAVWFPESRRLTWSDEFNGSVGAAPNPKKWTHDLGAGGWGNNDRQFYTSSRKNSYMDGKGCLIIRAIREEYKGASFTSARLKTLRHFSQKYADLKRE